MGKRGRIRLEDLAGWGFILPLITGLLLFRLYPLVESLRLSFCHTNGVVETWAGWDNYRYLLLDDDFWEALRNTLVLGGMGMAISIPGSLVLATWIHSARWGRTFFRAVYFLPNITSMVAVAVVFQFLFYPTDQGLINYVLTGLGFPAQGWFADPDTSKLAVALMGVWHGIGYSILIVLAGLQSVPGELYEAASIDGAGPFRQWWHVTLPGVRPILVFLLITGMISAMRRFNDVWMIGGEAGNPGGSLSTLMLYIYRVGFHSFELGKASAAAYLLFVVVFLLTLAHFRLIRFQRRE